jgi:hypothetical protein
MERLALRFRPADEGAVDGLLDVAAYREHVSLTVRVTLKGPTRDSCGSGVIMDYQPHLVI